MRQPDLSGVTARTVVPLLSSAVRRLYSTFAHGAPGAGLLLVRLASGTDLGFHGIVGLMRASGLETNLLHSVSAALGLLLLAGLWTPIAGVLVALCALSYGLAHPTDGWQSLLLGTIGAALALLGPGGWSIDARLFGWKRIEIPNHTRSDRPP